MADVFEEVEEQLRSDQYLTAARRLLPWAIGLLVAGLAIAGGYWAYTDYQTRQAGKAAESYALAMESYAKGDKAAAFTQFGTVTEVGSRGYKALALMQQGAMGIVYGRNVVQHRDPTGMTRALMAIVHDGATAADAARFIKAV